VITLYYSPATASMVVHWLLIDLGIPHQIHLVDIDKQQNKTAEYLRLNPAGVIPTLDLDGQVITEAAAITMHLGDLHNLAPAPGTPARAAYYQWMFFMANTLQPHYRAWFYPTEPAGEGSVGAAKEQARLRIEAAWARVETHLAAGGPYLLGELTAADFMLTMLMRWSRNMPRPAHTHPALGACAARMKARPSWKRLYEVEGLTEWA